MPEMMTGFLGMILRLAMCWVQQPAGPATPESKAITFLSREVPRWSRENHCYSCHNNGDGARALYLAVRAGWREPAEALAETDRWLRQPKRWEQNGGKGANSDKRLARIVFTATLATAIESHTDTDRSTANLAAELLARDQSQFGFWSLEGEDSVNSPATYGRLLATFMARQALAEIDAKRFHVAIARADRWLVKQEIVTVTDAAVSLLVCSKMDSPAAIPRRSRAVALLRPCQGDDGGWGPRTLAPSEPFDTALVLLGLATCPQSDEIKTMIARGRDYLIAEQLDDGSWVETTRPAGNISYAQRISTCGWATMALLATRHDERSTRRRTDSKGQSH
jgi:hypothetical protein